MIALVINVINEQPRESNQKSPGKRLEPPARAGVVFVRSLEQIEFLCSTDRGSTIIYAKLAVNVFGVGMQGI